MHARHAADHASPREAWTPGNLPYLKTTVVLKRAHCIVTEYEWAVQIEVHSDISTPNHC